MEKVLLMKDLNLTGKTWIAVLEEDKFNNGGGGRDSVLKCIKLFISFISGFISAQLRIE